MAVSILYVEDELDYQLLVQRILGKVGFEVRVAESGEQGLAALALEIPDMVILDINLPDTDGYALCQTLRQNPLWCELPILMLTVKRRPEEWLKGFSQGADDYLSKPLNPPELIERVQACLEGKSKRPDDSDNAEFLLTRAAVAGNRPAFEVLIQKYKQRLIDSLRAAGQNAADADDLASWAFTQAYERLDQFRGRSTFYTWLYRIAMNQSHHQRRGEKGVSFEEFGNNEGDFLPMALAKHDRQAEDISQRVMQAQIRRAVSYIPRPYRQMLDWHFMRGLSYEAMARRLKIPPGTVMSRLFKAKQLLKSAWRLAQSKN